MLFHQRLPENKFYQPEDVIDNNNNIININGMLLPLRNNSTQVFTFLLSSSSFRPMKELSWDIGTCQLGNCSVHAPHFGKETIICINWKAFRCRDISSPKSIWGNGEVFHILSSEFHTPLRIDEREFGFIFYSLSHALVPSHFLEIHEISAHTVDKALILCGDYWRVEVSNIRV